MKRIICVLGDQLDVDLAGLRAMRPGDVVVMAEVDEEGTYVPHHPQKIALILSAMRHFARDLSARGVEVRYTRLDDPDNTHSIVGELLRHARACGATALVATAPGDWRLRQALAAAPLPIEILPDDRFLCSEEAFRSWAEGRKQLRMEFFYREMRRTTGLLMDKGAPVGGQWNFDHDNRKPAKPDLFRPRPPRFPPDAMTREVMDLVAARFPSHPGRLDTFGWAVARDDALRALAHFVEHALPRFGDEQDAMLVDDPTLSHALISPTSTLVCYARWRCAWPPRPPGRRARRR